MTGKIGSSPLIVTCVLILLAGCALKGFPSSSICEEGIKLKIVTDRTSYPPGASMHVTLTVMNRSKTSFYFFRHVDQCSSQMGWLSLQLLDRRDHIVEHWGCSSDIFDFGDLDIVEILAKQESGVLLEPGEIYGREEVYELPKKAGTFYLHAELAPVGFLTEQQKESLSQHRMKVLRSTCTAPPVTLVIK
jgi:hypothetical protein